MLSRYKGILILSFWLVQMTMNVNAQVNFMHPPDTIKISPLGKDARIEWVFEQPDTFITYSDWSRPYGYWQIPNHWAMGVVFDLGDYPGATLEEIDFVFAGQNSEDTEVYYRIYVFDMDNSLIALELDSIKTYSYAGFYNFEVSIDLGSLPYIAKPGIFIKGLSTVDGSSFYPCPMTDNTDLTPGTSFICINLDDPFNGSVFDISNINPQSTDINLNLWINYGPEGKIAAGLKNPIVQGELVRESYQDYNFLSYYRGVFASGQSPIPASMKSVGKGFYVYRGADAKNLTKIDSVNSSAREYVVKNPSAGPTTYAVSSFSDTVESKKLMATYSQPALLSVAEAIRDENQNFIPDLLGENVYVQGIVTTPNFNAQTYYFLQHGSSGVALYSDLITADLEIGDSLIVAGKIGQAGGLTTLIPESVEDIFVLNVNNRLDTLEVQISEVGEAVEARLVKIQNVHCVNPEAWPAQGNDGQAVEISDGTNTIPLFIDKETELPGWTPPGGNFDLVGVVGQASSSTPPDDGYQLIPRFKSDFILLTSIQDENLHPGKIALYQNYPNPFNPRTLIRYTLPAKSDVKLKIYNALGQKVATLVSGNQPAGTYRIHWDAGDFPSGIYLYQLQTSSVSTVRKMILLK